MPDLDPLPGRPRVPDFRPRTGDYATVVGRAKDRRRRHLTAASAGAAGVAVVVALSVGGGGGTFGLKPVEPALPGTTSAPAATPEASPTAEPEPEPENTATPATTTPDPEGPGTSDEPTPDPVPVESPVRAEDGEEPHGDPPPVLPPVVVRDTIRNPATELCDSDPSLLSGTGWCLRYQGPARVASGTVHEYRTLACRPTGRGDGVLRFDTEQEVEFVVQYGEREEWRWSGGYQFPKEPHNVTVEDGYCARWTIEWDATGNDGDPLRPGTYHMSPYVATAFEGNGLWMSTASAYSLEVTE